MADVTVSARIASTRPLEKYGGISLDVRVLHQMATELNAGSVPMNFGHSSLDPVTVRNVSATVLELDDEHALDATFDVDAREWEQIEQRFAAAGVPGGFSFSAGEIQIPASRGQRPEVGLAADAAAFTDEERAEAWRRLEGTGSAQVSRLYQFDSSEIIRVIIDIWAITGPFVVNIASSGIYDALRYLVGRHQGLTVVEILDHRADGGTSTSVIRTNDPEMLRIALETMAAAGDGSAAERLTRHYGAEHGWVELPKSKRDGPPNEPGPAETQEARG
jgi:hypothetical protein